GHKYFVQIRIHEPVHLWFAGAVPGLAGAIKGVNAKAVGTPGAEYGTTTTPPFTYTTTDPDIVQTTTDPAGATHTTTTPGGTHTTTTPGGTHTTTTPGQTHTTTTPGDSSG